MKKIITLSVGVILFVGCGGSPDDDIFQIDISEPKEGENFTLPAQIIVQATNIPVVRTSGPDWYMNVNNSYWDFILQTSFESTFSDGILNNPSLYNTNNQFGDHMVVVKFVDTLGVQKTNGVTVQIFFNRDDLNPFGGNPNWYYYWSDTEASSGSHYYDPSWIANDGYYLHGSNFFYICPSAVDQDGGLVIKGEGIDNFGSTCLHEKGHMDYWLAT